MSTFNLINKTHYSGFYDVSIRELNTVLATEASAVKEMFGAGAAHLVATSHRWLWSMSL